MRRLRQTGTALLRLLYPPKCPFCRRLSPGDAPALCSQCQQTLPWREGTFTAPGVSEGVYALDYRDQVRQSLLRYKFSGCSAYHTVYGQLLAQRIAEGLPGAFDLVSYVPVSARTRAVRGYDQAQLLAEAVAAVFSVRAVPTLKKLRHNRRQSTLRSFDARRRNVRGVYGPVNPSAFAGRRVLLIDDIVTSGATLSEAARTLRSAGATSVVCATLASGRENAG